MALADADHGRCQHSNVLHKVEDLFSAIALLPAELREDVFQKIRIKLTEATTTTQSAQETDGPIHTSEENKEDEAMHVKSGNACDKVLGQVSTGGKVEERSRSSSTKNLINKENSKQKKSIKYNGKPLVKTNCRKGGKINKSQPKKCTDERITTRVSLRIEAKKTIKKSLIEVENGNDKDGNDIVNHDNGTSSNTCGSQKKPDKKIKKSTIEVKNCRNKDGNDVVNNDIGTSSNTCGSEKKPDRPKAIKKSLVEEDDDDNERKGKENDGNESDINDADNHSDLISIKNCDFPMRTFMVPHSFRQKDVGNLSQTAEDQIKTDSTSTENAEDAGKKEQRTKPCYGCMQCPRNFLQRLHLIIHMRTHTGEKPFVCPICKKGFSQKGALIIHMQGHEGRLNHDCVHCDYRTLQKIDMLRHVARMHSGERNFACEICSKTFSTEVDLKEHTRNVHERTSQHMCHLCGYVTHRADNLQKHLRVCHSTCEQHECPVCGRLINQRGTFLAHLRTHTGERPYGCSQCKKAFKSNSQLAKHMLTHGAGTFQCEVCSRLFKTRCHLLRHAKVHTGEKPYQCPHCEYSCNVTPNLNKHVRAVHGIADFAWCKVAPLKKDNEKAAEDGVNEERGSEANVTKQAKEKGKAATAHFLSMMSLRKDEGLTVSDLKIQLEAKQNTTGETVRPSRSKRPVSARKSKTKKRKIEDDETESDDDDDLITEAGQTTFIIDVIRAEDNAPEFMSVEEEFPSELETAIAVANASVILL